MPYFQIFKIYPQVFYNNGLMLFFENEKELIFEYLISKIDKPIKPLLPKKPIKPDYGFLVFIIKCSIIIFVVLNLIAFFIINSEFRFLFSLTLVIIILIVNYNIYNNINLKIKEYYSLSEEYPILLQNYHDKMNKYNNDIKGYNIFLEIIKVDLDNEIYLNECRIRYINEKKLLYSLRPSFEFKNENMGRSEVFFKKFLDEFFPNMIYTDKVLEVFDNDNAYVPDFTLIHNESDLTIDIEIDEPYYQNNPIHYIDNEHDKLRNEYFLKKGILIVRFSEEQVLNNPLGCCKFLGDIINELTGDYNDLYLNNNIENIYQHFQWNYNDSILLMKNNFRNIKNGRSEKFIGIFDDNFEADYGLRDWY